MQIRKIILVLFLILLVILLYNYVSFFRRGLDNLLLPSSYKEYPYLFENNIESKDYRIHKILNGSSYEDVLFHSETKNFIIEVPAKNSERNGMGWKTLWKINSVGKVIDSLETRDYMHPAGVFFDSNTYLDWIYSGDKTPAKYEKTLDFDSFSKVEFDSLSQKAKTIVYGNDYDNKSTNCYMKIDGKWWLFESQKAFERNIDSKAGPFFGHKEKNLGSIRALKNQIIPWQKWRDEKQFVHLQKFVAETRQFSSFLDINNTGRSGWNGTGYFRLTHNENNFYFKGYTFDGYSFHPNMSFYDAQDISIDTNDKIDISFISITKNHKSKARPEEEGVYVITRK